MSEMPLNLRKRRPGRFIRIINSSAGKCFIQSLCGGLIQFLGHGHGFEPPKADPDRETHSLTQSNVAAGTGLAESTLSEILAGKRKLSLKHVEACINGRGCHNRTDYSGAQT